MVVVERADVAPRDHAITIAVALAAVVENGFDLVALLAQRTGRHREGVAAVLVVVAELHRRGRGAHAPSRRHFQTQRTFRSADYVVPNADAHLRGSRLAERNDLRLR